MEIPNQITKDDRKSADDIVCGGCSKNLVKGSHLQFHLNNLVQAGYVTQEKPQGKYLITTKGLKALRFSYELSEVALSIS